jgi:hypothetical protein
MGWTQGKNGPPSDAAVACWRCRAITEEAARLQVKPAALKAWRGELWSRLGWCVLLTFGLAAMAALGIFGFALAGGADIGRTCELATGTFLAALSLVALTSIWIVSSKALNELRRLKDERDEARRYS